MILSNEELRSLEGQIQSLFLQMQEKTDGRRTRQHRFMILSKTPIVLLSRSEYENALMEVTKAMYTGSDTRGRERDRSKDRKGAEGFRGQKRTEENDKLLRNISSAQKNPSCTTASRKLN